jgi:hypothetical protein
MLSILIDFLAQGCAQIPALGEMADDLPFYSLFLTSHQSLSSLDLYKLLAASSEYPVGVKCFWPTLAIPLDSLARCGAQRRGLPEMDEKLWPD